jgi:methylase of polypeptide subunit release factors
MKKISKNLNYKSDAIPVDPFWNLGDEKEHRMHRIHAYPAKFPAFITTKALQYAKRRRVSTTLIADIFCGCGTVAYEAKRNGISFWGCDINPIATLIAKAKSNSYQTYKLLDYFELIEKSFYTSTFNGKPYCTANERIKYWFDMHSYHQLMRLRNSIDSTIAHGSRYHTFFMVAFSNILKPSSRWLTKSIKPQLDPGKEPIDVFEAFRKQCQFAISANMDNDASGNSSIHIETADLLSPSLVRPKVNMIITSPPYVTSYEYADLHQLSVLWLEPTSDYRQLRYGSIGSLHHDSDFDTDIEELNKSGKTIVHNLKAVDASKARSVAKYFVDMQAVAKKAHTMLSKKGLALFVIGNTKYSGVLIDNSRHLVESMFDAGFSDIRMTKRKITKKILTPYRNRNGRFTSDGRGRKVYSEEFIIVGKK